ncbi:MFS transporter [Janibacter cremeus]|uniref:MFS transporter n=1 Tax=Janibacter cremeus TaxID=1285192 RepID=UPI0023F6D548|nr:MFS transporter [Janibacter cremeus]WEV78722.1 MFS transporter [Janibacter cremeus]
MSSPGLLFTTLVLLTTITAVAGSLGAPLVPGIARDFGVPLGAAQWSLTLTMLAGAVATPVIGRLSGGRARMRAVVLGLGGATLGGLLCALPLGFGAFLAGRTLQGLGYGLTPVAIAIAREAIPRQRRAGAIAILSVTTVAAAGLGYPVAAVMADLWGIRVAFGVATALCAATLVLALLTLPPSPDTEGTRVDWWGTVLLAGGTTTILIALAEVSVLPIGRVALLATVGIVACAAWVWWSRRVAHPLVDVTLAARPVPLLTHATSMLMGVGVYLLFPLVVIVVQDPTWGMGYGATVAGLLLVPYALASVVGSRLSQRLMTRVEATTLLPLGSATYLSAFVLLVVAHDTVWQLLLAMAIAGLGSGLGFAGIPGLLVGSVPRSETGSAIAFTMVVRYLGFSVGSALAVTALTFGGEGGEAGFVRALLVACAVGVLTVVLTTWLSLRVRGGVGRW